MFAAHPRRLIGLLAALVALLITLGGTATLLASERPKSESVALTVLPVVRAASIRMDTLYLGGYASGSFAQAVQAIASDLSTGERMLVGRHLDKIFSDALGGEDLERGGRLRLAYERAVRPDGTPRSIRVLAAEAAVGGRMYTAFFFENDGQPGYYDNFGRSLEGRAWQQPLPDARVSSPFNSQRMHPILARVLPHLGIDYAAPHGTPVRAAGDGSVSIAERRGGYGNLIEIHHPNGYSSRYAHLSRFALGIEYGAAVRQGEIIGYVGSTGLATGPHLHYEVRRHGRPVDPELAMADATSTAELAYFPEWSQERERLATLLARAPRAIQRRSDSL
jgi:murein DD-endopeptidase MepM/ murein hydrolase activator NlpD